MFYHWSGADRVGKDSHEESIEHRDRYWEIFGDTWRYLEIPHLAMMRYNSTCRVPSLPLIRRFNLIVRLRACQGLLGLFVSAGDQG